MPDQRKSPRYAVDLHTEVTTIDRPAGMVQATVKNMSAVGVLLSTESELAIGERIEYVIMLPEDSKTHMHVRLRCLGRVVRTASEVALEAAGTQMFGATIDRYEFVRDAA